MRIDGRNRMQLRELKLELDYIKNALGSVLITLGDTKVICTAMVEDKVPPFLRNTNQGWLSAEYSMLPASTNQRKQRDSTRGRIDGRSQEIQRLIGRTLRSAIDLRAIGERTIWLDCDVIQADGGTRTAAITGAFIALYQAVAKLYLNDQIESFPIRKNIAAISVGKLGNELYLDLNYFEDSKAKVDMNVIMSEYGEFIEIQGTGETGVFTKNELFDMTNLAEKGIIKLIYAQKECLKEITEEVESKKNRLKIVIASNNSHKLSEISNILKDLKVDIISKSDMGLKDWDIEETGETLEENALLKARGLRDCLEDKSLWVLADDTGLFVDALNGDPGIHSARYANDDHNDELNNQKLLENMKELDENDRNAQFRTAMALIDPKGREYIEYGVLKGQIASEKFGDNGFGYDPLFIPDGYELSYAQMGNEQKNKISHRYNALIKIKELLENLTK
ncbi:MAG: ribonuclease PH [Tissierellia bacterium]|nr:ribonuclease PH [Tissierellia bacterium]